MLKWVDWHGIDTRNKELDRMNKERNQVVSPTLRIILSVIVVVFMMIMAGIMSGNAKIAYCGVYKPWKWNANKIWFVENTCRDLKFTK